MEYETIMLSDSEDDIRFAAKLINDGHLVGMPTETVYGLAADALNPKAVEKIFIAKGRPQDNPLIVHLGDFSQVGMYAEDIPEMAYRIAEKFCPGPITMVLKKKDIIPMVTSGGLDTVGIRIPGSKTARDFITACNKPIAAPSANRSGSPSPTTAQHVYNDLNGRISGIIDNGSSAIGLESTVVTFDGDKIILLRPGFVTAEDLGEIGEVVLSRGIVNRVDENERVLSPGMKYKHYSPKANVTIVDGNDEAFYRYVSENRSDRSGAMIFDYEAERFKDENIPFIGYGNNSVEQAKNIFSALRRFDEMNLEQVYAHCPSKNGVGLAVYNRLLRAAGFEVIKV